MEAIELDLLAGDSQKRSGRPSLEQDYIQNHSCEVYIWDDAVDPLSAKDPHFVIHGNRNPSRLRNSRLGSQTSEDSASRLPQELQTRIARRDASRTRWINVVGWSEDLIGYLSQLYLSDHGCLGLYGPSKAVLGGPVSNQCDQEFIWLRTKVWFMASKLPNWSSIEEVELRMVVIQPNADKAGTVITNFIGKQQLAREMNTICTDALIENHPFGARALGCSWIVSYAILRTVAEQIDFAFRIFDPVSIDRLSVPRMDDLPSILEKASNLSRLDRYLSELEQLASFFEAVQKMCEAEHADAIAANASVILPEAQAHPRDSDLLPCHRLVHRATLERLRLQQKIRHSQRLSRTYLTQYESLIQMGITYATTQITERLDSGRAVAERFATIGIFLGGVSSLLSPFALLTSYFGMNVSEFVGQEGGLSTLYEFWKVGMPLVVVAGMGMGYLCLRLLTGMGR